MNTERIIRIVAGTLVLVSLVLGVRASPLFVSRDFIWLTAFIGLNLFQSGWTRFCPLERFLVHCGILCSSNPSRSIHRS